jgi:hypothetical protein
MKIRMGVVRPRLLPSAEEEAAMNVLVSAYAAVARQLRGLELFEVEEYQDLGDLGPITVVTRRLVPYVFWVPPMTEAPDSLIDLVRRTDEDEEAQWSALTTAVIDWLNKYPQMQQCSEALKFTIAQITIHLLLM